MSSNDPLIRNISDTAAWVAVYRADETDRPDALFRDPFARKLAGERGPLIANSMRFARRNAWPFVMRTYLGDEFIMSEVKNGTDMVINLAAGLDARPYRMALPPSLTWVEIDLPGILDYKERILKDDKPVCALERIRLDLSDVAARRAVFDALAARAKRILVIAEGLLIYLDTAQVAGLARDLSAHASMQRFICELASPGLLRMMHKEIGSKLDAAGAPFKFGPPEGPEYFVPLGWKPLAVRSMFREAAKLRRLPFLLSLFSFLPDPKGPAGNRPWSGVCLFGRT